MKRWTRLLRRRDATGKPAEEPSQKHFKSSRGTAAVGGTFKARSPACLAVPSPSAFALHPPLLSTEILISPDAPCLSQTHSPHLTRNPGRSISLCNANPGFR